MSQRFDLLLRGGHLVDPGQRIDDVRDVAVDGGRVAAVDHRIPEDSARRVIDLTGRYVTPGLIDLHVHFYKGTTKLGLDPDADCLPRGVTTNVDTGSAGAATFDGLATLMASYRSRAYCFVHISTIGLAGLDWTAATQVGELWNILYADPEGAARVIRTHSDRVLGVKVRMSERNVDRNGPLALWMATRVARETGSRVMVHIGDATVDLAQIAARLAPGDIITHCFTYRSRGVLDARGRLIPEIVRAAERGVLFDVGHGRESFAFDVARAALAQGFLPHTISTDLTAFALNSIVYDLVTVMSQFLELGLTLSQMVERTTVNAAQIIGREHEIGTLRPGMLADIAAFELEEGAFAFEENVKGGTMMGRRRLKPVLTVLGGEVVYEVAKEPSLV